MNAPVRTDRMLVTFDRRPEQYDHWKLDFDGPVATLTLDIAEDKGIVPGYKLKLNSYDLGVDIELHDALNRIRFEHPEVKSVVVTSGKTRMFCSGANIYMLGASSHAWKVGFCKFTNETRNGLEDSSTHSGLKFLAALNGTTAGGGYELALACDEIAMIDDRSSTVSLPEVPLLGVLPGTGGLTRVIDKRKVRRDLADVFCTTAEGVRADRAKQWGLVDHVAKPQQFPDLVKARALELAAQSDRPGGQGVALTPLERTIDESGYRYSSVEVHLNRDARTATITISVPEAPQPQEIDEILAQGAAWWPLTLARELDDALLMLRHNELDVGLWLFKTRGKPDQMLAIDATLARHAGHWFVRETIGLLRRALARLEVSSRSMFAIADQGSCFAGTLAELLFAADRAYMLHLPEEESGAPHLALSEANFGLWPTVGGDTRLQARFCGRDEPVEAARQAIGNKLSAHDALELGLVTAAPDDLDWEDEIRLAVEERASLSPDALTGMEANLRFAGRENMLTRVFGRLSAWQNWIFIRPNAVGQQGALKVYGSGARPKFNWERV